MLHERGRRYYAAPATPLLWIISHVTGNQEIHRRRERNGKKGLVVNVWQVQAALLAGINRQTIFFNFRDNIANALGIKFEARASKDLLIFSKDALVVTNLNSVSQRQREYLSRISFGLKQARHEDIGVEHDSHLRRARRAVVISASMSEIDNSDVPFCSAACCSDRWA